MSSSFSFGNKNGLKNGTTFGLAAKTHQTKCVVAKTAAKTDTQNLLLGIIPLIFRWMERCPKWCALCEMRAKKRNLLAVVMCWLRSLLRLLEKKGPLLVMCGLDWSWDKWVFWSKNLLKQSWAKCQKKIASVVVIWHFVIAFFCHIWQRSSWPTVSNRSSAVLAERRNAKDMDQ